MLKEPPLLNLCECALFLDVDGTILDIAPRPEEAIVSGELKGLLADLYRSTNIPVAFITGRSLQSLDALFGIEFDASGCHGAETRRGGDVRTVSFDKEALDVAAKKLGTFIDGMSGAFLEYKPCSIALHHRLSGADQFYFVGAARRAIEDLNMSLKLIMGKEVVEILPVNADKGCAVEAYMKHPPYACRRPVYVGDDVTDEDGFSAVNRFGGISVHVGEARDTNSQYRFRNVSQTIGWLRRMLNAARVPRR